MPAQRKANRLSNRPERARPVPAVVEVTVVPAVPTGLGEEAAAWWRLFWQEPQAGSLTPAQVVVVERFVVAYEEWHKACRVVAETPLVVGSTGQPVMNPLAGWVASREATMAVCERQLGLGLRNRADLGVAFGLARKASASEVPAGKRVRARRLDQS